MNRVRLRWVAGSFGLALTLGATTGAIGLVSSALGRELPADLRQIHAHTQVFGFVVLLATGFVEAALPAGLRAAPRRMPRATFWLFLAAVLLRNLCQPFAERPVARLGVFVSAALLLAGTLVVVSFVAFLLGEARPGHHGAGRRLALASAATSGYLVLVVGLNALQALWIAAGNGPVLPRPLAAAFYDAALSGGLLAAGFTAGLRLAPSVGQPDVRRGYVSRALALQGAGVAFAVVAWLPSVPPGVSLGLHDAGQLLVSIAVFLYLRATGLASWRGPRPVAEPSLHASDVAVRLSFSALGLWAAFQVGTVVLGRFTSLAVRSRSWDDATRHLLAVGFVTLLVAGAAGRFAPLIFGRPLQSGGLQRATVALVASGALLRLLEYPAILWPPFDLAASVMGVPVVAGLGLLAWNLARTARAAPAWT